jgi:hypothetical protein
VANGTDINIRGKDAVGADEAFGLKDERVKCGEENYAERAKENPARAEMAVRA